MKNKILDSHKLWTLLEKSVLIILILILIVSLGIFNTFKSIDYDNSQIKIIQSEISDKKQKLESIKKYDSVISNTNWINFDLWIKDLASIANLYIYDNTNNFKILSEKSQEELNEISKNFKIIKENKDYSKIVKFIIIDKRKNTFLTNDTNNIEFIKNNLQMFSNENGELYNYVSSKGKWYNISYTSQSSPAYKIYGESIVKNTDNFVEAYWFPKNYSYSKEDEPILKNVLKTSLKDSQEGINSQTKYISYLKSHILRNKIIITICSILIIIMMLTLYFLGKERIIKGLKNNFVTKLLKIINYWFGNRSTLFKITIFVLLTSSVLLMFIGLIFYGLQYIFILLILLYLILIFPQIIKFSKYIDEIIHGIDNITSGNLNYTIEEKGDKSLSSLAHNINKLNKGFKVSIEDQIKNEKLKSELVANVSHDLKTPLTSIINYTDILLRENISEEEREDFLKVLNRKSLKLKTLIEDLFEISKINSGKVELNKENVDVIELLNQSLAEYSDTEIYTDKNLTFILKTFTEKIEMNLDGNKLSRVFENIINNALKYSLKDTRVYIEIEDIGKGIKISFKNISSIALDFNKEEIFERFTRGDASRNSNIDGNGLGLAIAKSIVELHDGIMYVDFDGDLFKSIIELYY